MANQEEKKEAGNTPEPAAKKAKGGGALRLPLVLGAVLLAQMAISYALITQVLFRIDGHELPAEETTLADDREEIGSVFLIPELVVNPAGHSGMPRYIKCGFGIEVDSEAAYTEIETRQPQVLDTLIGILTSKSLDEVDTLQEKDLIRMEIQEQLNDRMITGTVTNIYLTDFVIQ